MNRIALVAILLASAAGAARAQTEAELVDWLNRSFAPEVWSGSSGLIADHTIHQIRTDLEQQGLTLDAGRTSVDLAAPPGFTLAPPGLVVRFPATGHYTIRLRAEYEIPVITNPSVEVTVHLSIRIPIGPTATGDADLSDLVVDVDVDLPTAEAAGIVLLTGDPSTAVMVAAAGAIFEGIADGIVEGDLSERLDSRIRAQLGFFGTMRWDPAAGLAYAVPDRMPLAGHRQLAPAHALDVLLVGDGYGAAQMGDLDALAADMALRLRTTDGAHVSEPYARFASAIRVESLRTLCADPNDPRHRIVSSFQDAATGTRKTAYANLARLAAVGLRGAALGADVVVIVARRGGALDADARASATPRLVLQPDTADAASVLLHELGHTVLGGLGDEYVDRPGQTYRGFEPSAVNLTIQRGAATRAGHPWHFWATGLAAHGEVWDTAVGDFEGGYYFESGVFRPCLRCKMSRSGEEVPFCPVCREALTLGIRRLLPAPSALVELQYLSPWTSAARLVDVAAPGGAGSLSLEAYPGIRPTRLSMRLLASAVPEPWTVRWSVYPDAGSVTPFVVTGPSPAPFRVDLGGRVVLEIGSGCRFTPRHPVTPIRIEFRFDRPRTPSAPPTPPTALAQSAALGARIPVDYDPATGDARFSLGLTAAPGTLSGWDLPTRVEFRTVGPVEVRLTGTEVAAGTATTVRVPVLPAGDYRWEARTVFGQGSSALASAWASIPLPGGARRHFEVARPTLATTPVAPRDPTCRSASPLHSGGPFELHASSFDPNGDRLRFQFEVKPAGTAFDGRGLIDTGLLSGTLASLSVKAFVPVGPFPGVHRWRVRAVDETGRASAWVDGGQVGGTTGLSRALSPLQDVKTLQKLEALSGPKPGPLPDPFGWK